MTRPPTVAVGKRCLAQGHSTERERGHSLAIPPSASLQDLVARIRRDLSVDGSETFLYRVPAMSRGSSSDYWTAASIRR